MTRLGEAVTRLEDDRLLRGYGRFQDAVVLPGQLYLRVVRSTVAHGRIRSIVTAGAEARCGVVTVVTAADLPSPARIPSRQPTPGMDFTPYLQEPLASKWVRYVGDPVAAVVADDPYVAEDAAEQVLVDIEELKPELDARACADSPLEAFGGAPARVGVVESSYGDVDRAFASAAHVIGAVLRTGRHTGTPLENRGLTARWDRRERRMTVWGSSKVPYWNRRIIASHLGLAEHQIHMLEADVGGSFGIRGELYPEDILVPWLAVRTGRPVKWTEDRAEHLIAANHAREQLHEISLAFDEDQRLLGLRCEAYMDSGAYIRTHGAVVATLTAGLMSGPYRLPAMHCRVHVVLTNKTPVGTYRGPGRFSNTFAREHLLDVAATRLGVDPVELRMRNLLGSTELPLERPMRIFGAPMLLDGNDHVSHLAKALRRVGYRAWLDEAAAARAIGRLVGVGMSVILEKAGLGHDSAVVTVDGLGAIRVAMGGTTVGQGIETTMAQIVADRFDVPISTVKVVLSDTDILQDGAGTFASRSTVVGGSAAAMAADAVIAKARRIGAQLLDVSADDLDVTGGFVVDRTNTARRMPLAQISALCTTPMFVRTGDEPGLVGRATFAASTMTYPYGAHFAMVEVDERTGAVSILRYAISYEIGRAVNPAMVKGQLTGGAVQGIGGALSEQLLYDDNGGPLITSLEDYRWMRATDVPDIDVHVFEDSPAPGNPLGVRGAGEGGISGPGATLANAVRAAIGLRGDVGSLPLRADHVLDLIRQARSGC